MPGPTCKFSPTPPRSPRAPARRDRLGFTLIELLVVVAILAMLVGIAVPVLSGVRRLAARALCTSNLNQINTAFALYLKDHGDIYPCNVRDQDDKHALWTGRGWREYIGPYIEGGNVIDKDNPSVLWCKSDTVGAQQYGSTSYGYSMAFYHSVQQINSLTSAMDKSLDSIAQGIQKVEHTGSKIIVGEWHSNHYPIGGDEKGWFGWKGQRNFLFVDGHVTFLLARDIKQAQDKWPDPNLTIDGIKGRDVD